MLLVWHLSWVWHVEWKDVVFEVWDEKLRQSPAAAAPPPPAAPPAAAAAAAAAATTAIPHVSMKQRIQ